MKNGRISVLACLAFILVLVGIISGCSNDNDNINSKDTEISAVDQFTEGQPSKLYAPNDISDFTPAAQNVAQCFAQDDYPGALEVLYEDILNAGPSEDDLFFTYVGGGTSLHVLFYNPKKIFEIYRDSDRTGWSDDEKAAADFVVALTYENGDFTNLQPDEDWVSKAAPLYEEITKNYGNSNIAACAKIELALSGINGESLEEYRSRAIQVRDEIMQKYPNSTFLTWAQLAVASSYSEKDPLALMEYRKVLELPDVVITYDISSPYHTAHAQVKDIIKDMEPVENNL